MHFGRLSCLLNLHRPRKRTAHWNGMYHVGLCRSCGNNIIRKRGGGWRRTLADEMLIAQDQVDTRQSSSLQ